MQYPLVFIACVDRHTFIYPERISWNEEEISFESNRYRVWPERVRVAAGLLQAQPAQPLLPREGVDPGVRPAPRVIRESPLGGVVVPRIATSHDSRICRRTCLSSTASTASRNHARTS